MKEIVVYNESTRMITLNPFSTNVPLMDKPVTWFLNQLGHRPASWVKMSLFKHFASKTQLPGFYISGTLVEMS